MYPKSIPSPFILILISTLYLMPVASKAQLKIESSSDLYIAKGETISFDGISFTPDPAGSGYTFPATTLEKTADWISSTTFLNPHLKKYYSFSNAFSGFTGKVAIDHSEIITKEGKDGTQFNNPTDLRLNAFTGSLWTVPTAGNITNSTVEATVNNESYTTFAVSAVNAPLPVTLLSFNGRVTSAGVALQWVTASEINSSHFDVERSGNGRSFAKIGSVNAAGRSTVKKNYDYLDANPLVNQSWYRLKQIDLDGKYTYSSVLPINRDAKISSYPNPVSNQLQLQLSQDWKGTYDLVIYDNAGRVIMKQQVKSGSYMFDCANWANGMYNVIIYQESQQVYEQKILKN